MDSSPLGAVMSPQRLLRLYMFVVLAAASVAIVVLLTVSARIDTKAQQSTDASNAAVQAARIQAGLADPILALANGYFGLFFSPTFQSLPIETQSAARMDAFRAYAGAQPVSSIDITLALPDRELLAFGKQMDTYLAQIDKLVTEPDSPLDVASVRGQRDRARAAFDAYLGTPSLANYNALFGALARLQANLREAGEALSEHLVSRQDGLTGSTDFARYAMVAALLVLTVITGVATFFIGRMLQTVLGVTEREHDDMRQTSERLKYRNDQLTALYNVFSEITETLSLRYVVKATLRESIKVMHANMAVIRLLKGDELVLEGGLVDDGSEFPPLPPVPLGEGPTGRAARRGRAVLVKEGAQDLLGPRTDPARNVESGIVVPLIVGARVVGTLSCWSYLKDAFTEEDQHVLEMMASQVATAVVAANTTDTSEHRARHDPLTGLPNRLQLNADLPSLESLGGEGRQAVVAMVDIDRFKRFNDDFGHRVGDVTLQKVASVLRTAVRDKDRVYRFGGEEFLVVFMDAGEDEAQALAERVRIAVERTPLSGEELEPVGPVTISIGLSLLPVHSEDFGALIGFADNAMYQAKGLGRNRVVLWEPNAARAALVA